MAACCGSDHDESHTANTTVWMPRGAEPFLRQVVHAGGVGTHLERLKPNRWGRHCVPFWVTLIAFAPASADVTLWPPEGSGSTVHLDGGLLLAIPPGWSWAMVWHQTADAITLFAGPQLVREQAPKVTQKPALVEIAACLAARRAIADVLLDLRQFMSAPHGPSDRQVATGGSYLAVLLWQALGSLTDGKFRPTGLFVEVITRMRTHLEHHPKRRVPVAEIARAVGISDRQLRRVVRHETGKTPVEWVREEKARQFRELIARGLTIKQAVAASGFCNPSHAHRAMVRVFGGAARAFR